MRSRDVELHGGNRQDGDDGSDNGQTDSTQTDPGQSVDIDSFCEIMNTNIASLQTTLEAFEGDDYVASFEETKNSMPEDYATYSVRFNAGTSAEIWCRKDGNDSKGVPQISAAQDENGKWYWTLDGKWLSIGGSTVPVLEGDDAPRICAEDGRWMISGDAGATWKDLSEMDGQAVSPGKYIFDDVYKKGSFLHLVLDNGETLPISTLEDIDIIFTDADGATCVTGETARIAYEVVGWDEATEVICSCDTPGWEAEIESTGINTGYVVVTNTGAGEDAAVTVTADNSTGDEISKALIFVKGILTAKADVENIGGDGGIVDVEITTNTDYTVSIPSEASGWISVVDDGTKSELRTETIKLAVAGYESGPDRSATVSFTVSGKVVSTIYIEQKSRQTELDEYISFADWYVKECLIDSREPLVDLNRDDEISYREALQCSKLPRIDVRVTKFNEFQFFNPLIDFKSAFAYDVNLTSVILPEGMENISNSAFRNCYSLKNINFPKSLISIGDYAFYECSVLPAVTLPEGLISIGDHAFIGVRSVNLPESLVSIGDSAFLSIKGLSMKSDMPNLTSIGDFAFGASSIQAVNLPNVEKIGCGAFWASDLKTITLSQKIDRLEPEVFKACYMMTSIDIPSSVTSIGYEAFAGCRSLASINIPERVTIIEEETFAECERLVSIDIPESVTSIGIKAFYQCSSLAELTFHSVNPPELSNNSFYGCPIRTVYVPSDGYEAYRKVLKSKHGFGNATILTF